MYNYLMMLYILKIQDEPTVELMTSV